MKTFYSKNHSPIPGVDESQMREVDRIAEEVFSLGILQMMENAGRNLAYVCMQTLEEIHGRDVLIMAGSGGNGGGGICCARHLVNHGYKVSLVTTRETEELRGAAKSQWTILQKSGFKILAPSEIQNKIKQAALVIDALIGYSLHGPPRGFTSELIGLCNQHAKHIISLDMPSGMDASNGNTPGIYIKPRKTITLALPKAGLKNPEAGELVLADIGIPAAVYRHIGIHIETIFGKNYQVPIYRSKNF